MATHLGVSENADEHIRLGPNHRNISCRVLTIVSRLVNLLPNSLEAQLADGASRFATHEKKRC